MINSSPDYAITKPGMTDRLLPKRNKPLRTYGKRSTPTTEPRDEPAAKKAKLEPNLRLRTTPTVASGSLVDGTSGAPESLKPCVTAPPRSSILRYFEPLASHETALDEKRSIVHDPMRSVVKRKKRPRLLKIRASSPLSNGDSEDKTGTTCEVSPSLPLDDRRTGLRNASDKLINQRGMAEMIAKTDRRSRTAQSPTVQMTLNISSQAAFAECKTCDIVWNPLFPDDVKYHERRHRAATRKRERTDEL